MMAINKVAKADRTMLVPAIRAGDRLNNTPKLVVRATKMTVISKAAKVAIPAQAQAILVAERLSSMPKPVARATKTIKNK